MCMHSGTKEKPVSKKKAQREADIRDHLMTQVPKQLPDAVDDWIEDFCLSNRHYIYYDKKDHYTYCTRCKKELDPRLLTDRSASHNSRGMCPVCKHDVTYKCIGRYGSKRHHYYYDNNSMDRFDFSVSVIQQIQSGILIRKFYMIRRVYKIDRKAKVELKYSEELRIFNDANVPRRFAKGYHDDWYASAKTSLITPEYQYHGNLNEVVKDTPFKYAKMTRDHDYFAAWIKPVEYLEKTKWFVLANDILQNNTKWLNLEAKSIDKFLRLPKQAIKFAQQSDFNINELVALRIWLKENGSLPKNASQVKTLNSAMYYFRGAKKIVPGITAKDFTRFAETAKNHIHYWTDYLRFCVDLGYDMTMLNIIFPSDIREAHDREMNRLKLHKNEAQQKAIASRYEIDARKFGYQDGPVMIRPPKDMSELLQEGSKLGHCVGTYADRVAEKKTTILFIRHTDEPDEPYFTLEWNGGRIIQCRGMRNKETTPEVKAFLELWQKEISKKQKRVKVAASAI